MEAPINFSKILEEVHKSQMYCLFDWELMSHHVFPLELIDEYDECPWDFEEVSFNGNLTMDFIEKHIDRRWDWNLLNQHPDVTFDFLKDHNRLDYHRFSENPNLTMEQLIQNIDEYWNFETLSSHPNLTLEIVERFPDKRWNYKIIFHRKLT